MRSELFYFCIKTVGIIFAIIIFDFCGVIMKNLKNLLQIVSVFALGFFWLQSAPAQSRSDRALINEAVRITSDDFSFTAQTPKGARVYAVNQPNSKMLNAIDKGLSDLFTIAQRNNYQKRLNYADYTIFIAKADRTKNIDKNYSPDIAIGAAQYAGSVYDQGGFVYAAGMVLAYNPCAFVFAEHTKDFHRVSEIVRYEGEHIVLYHNDRKRYNKTADHSQGGGHPILQ
jgi:hypothetical protein